MWDKFKYYIIAFFSGVLALALFFLGRKPTNVVSTTDIDKRIDDKKEHIKELASKEVKIESLNDEEVKDYWRN